MEYRPYQAEVARLKKVLDRFAQFHAVIGGIYYQIMEAQSSLILILTASFFLRLLVMAVLFYFYFRSFRLLVIFLLSNEFPVLACVLFLYLCRFSLNVATVMVFPVSIGIVVGNTFHIIYALTRKTPPRFEEYFNTIVIPVLLGTLTLVLGFAVVGFYGFIPIQQFGTALAFTVFLGMLSGLYIVPTLINRTTDLRGFLSQTAKQADVSQQ
jgi:predicted RND superfamily exporter protein